MKPIWLLIISAVLVILSVGGIVSVYAFTKKTIQAQTAFNSSPASIPGAKSSVASTPKIEVATPVATSNIVIKDFVTSDSITLPVIMYHHILGWAGAENDAIERGLRISPEVFERHLLYIKEKCYTTITTKTLYEYATGQKPLPSKPILLTFDDGYTDNYTLAYPLLKKYNMVGDFALITGLMGSTGFMTWDQAREMLEQGQYFSSHTVHHCYMAPKLRAGVYGDTPVDPTYKGCNDFNLGSTLTSGQVLFELAESKITMEQQLGVPIVSIVYPYGNFNSTVIKLAKEAGYQIGFSVVGQRDEQLDLANPLAIPRYRGFGQDSTGTLQGFFAGGR